VKRRSVTRTPKTYTTEKRTVASSSRTNVLQFVDWYERQGADLAEAVFGRVRQIKQAQITRRFELYTYQQAYNSRFGPQLMAQLFSPATRNPSAGLYGISANIIKSCIDTACARISKEKPRAFVLPKKGNYRLKKKARNLQKFLDGVMQSSGFYSGAEDVFRDACIYDGGAMLIWAPDGAIKAEPLKVDEVQIDQVDGMFNDPREVHWTHPEPRKKLLKRYPQFAKEIELARSQWRGEMSFMGQADLVEVVRSWRRPSAPGAGDGRHTVAICTATLEDEPWTKDYLPIIRFHWTPPTYGPWGDGIAKELFGLQRALTDILKGIVKSIRMFAVPRVWVSKLSNVATTVVSNEISVNEYAGDKPVFETPPAASPDVYQFVQWVIDWAYKQLGLSQLTAQSEKPAGLNSGVAMRTYQDVETQRFALVGQRWERFFMAAARLFIDTAADVYKDKGALSMTVPGRGFVEQIDWKDASIDDDLYDLEIWPTGILPETPEGKFQAVQEWINSGFMPKDIALQQMRMPILNDWIAEETAARDNIERCLASILERPKPKYLPPDAITNVDLAVTMAMSAKLIAEDEDVEPERIELVQRWLDRALQLQALKRAPLTPPGQPTPVVGQAPTPPPAPMAPAGAGPVQAAAA